MSKPFQFKEFTIRQDRTAMQVGTDGVLLGAWVPIKSNPQSILDIGTGTGVIALMLAQRSDAPTIDALELDDEAYEQAAGNFEESPWNDRLFCYHAHLYEFITEIDETYDLIVCNPPFFEAGKATENPSRDLARYEEAMPFELLVAAATKFLNPDGIFAVILPIDRHDYFSKLASEAGLYPLKTTQVKGREDLPAKRILIAFTTSKPENSAQDTLVIEHSRHVYTEAYQKLTRDFYLKM